MPLLSPVFFAFNLPSISLACNWSFLFVFLPPESSIHNELSQETFPLPSTKNLIITYRLTDSGSCNHWTHSRPSFLSHFPSWPPFLLIVENYYLEAKGKRQTRKDEEANDGQWQKQMWEKSHLKTGLKMANKIFEYTKHNIKPKESPTPENPKAKSGMATDSWANIGQMP